MNPIENKNPVEAKSESKGVSPEKKEAKKKANEAKKKAFEVLKEFVDKSNRSEIVKALQTVRPSLYGISPQGNSGVTSQFLDLVTSKGSVKEDQVFAELKLGRRECMGIIRKALKKAEPADRLWIDLDPKTGVYKLAGKGENAPNGWDGYIPVEESIDLK